MRGLAGLYAWNAVPAAHHNGTPLLAPCTQERSPRPPLPRLWWLSSLAAAPCRAGPRPSGPQMIGHIHDDARFAVPFLAEQQHGFELECGLVVEQVLPPAGRHNFWENDHR